ncbi:hypothetical protein [Amycolatopsis sp. NPDC021455]|uniref:hypothetical protein n=1 Tax=Amycolatopsis sp. NPDC021455 TaxID=3154901 RepID=UPI003407967A
MATETIVRKTCDWCKTRHGRSRDAAVFDEQFGLFGKQCKIDLCGDCYTEFDNSFRPWFDAAQHLGKQPKLEIPPDMNPFPNVGVFTDRGFQRPDPRVDVVWWRTPAGANTATKAEYKAARETIWKWAENERVDGKPRFGKISKTHTGVLPDKIGFAWTREVWVPMQALAEETVEEEQALIPPIGTPPAAAKPRRRRVTAGKAR